MARALRLYQRQAVEAVRADWGRGVTRPAVVLPTGTGKSSIIAQLAVDHAREHGPGSTLLLGHRSELLGQMSATCNLIDPTIPVGRWQATQRDGRRPITAGSVQTLQNEKARAELERLNGRPSLVICDEAHHYAAPSFSSVLAWAGSFAHVPTLGLTATMVRGDRIGLGDVWQSVAFQRDIGWAISQGYLVPPRGKVVVIDTIDLEHAKIDRSKGDYAEGELGEMIEQGVDQIVDSWLKHASERPTAAFCPTVDAAYALAAEFVGRGISAEVVVGETKRPDRDAIYARLASGATRVLVGVMVTTEGWDCPPVSCILQCRPTRLPGLYQQIVGRGLRTLDPALFPGHEPKEDCLVLDVVGASRYQRLVSLVDLHPTAEIDTAELDALPCEVCGMVPCECPPVEDEAEGSALEVEKPRLLGPAEYEDIDLFRGSGLVWLFTEGGQRFLPAGDRTVVIWQSRKTGAIRVGHCQTKGGVARDGQWFADAHGSRDGWDLDTARMAAEAWAMLYAPTVASRTATWRKGKQTAPTQAQVNYAYQLGIPAPETMTKARLSDEISVKIASAALD